MRRLPLFAAALLAPAVLATTAIPSTAGAQTANPSAFCAARLPLGPSASPDEMKAGLATLAQNAGGAASAPAAALNALYAKKGGKTFNTDKAFGYLSEIDKYVYETCPGAALAVTAIDYEFQDVPTTLPAGAVKVKLTNAAPKEDHEFIIARLLPGSESMELTKLLSMPEKKVAKYVDVDGAAFTFAPAGEVGYTVTQLEPGKYLYACFLPVGGKDDGAPHFTKGMYGTFTVS